MIRRRCLLLILGLLPLGVHAQFSPRPEFEVASIKPSRAIRNGAIAIGTQSSPDTLTLTGIRLRDLIARAYTLQPYQIVGPARLDDEYYDIVAKSAQPAPDLEQRRMLQSLLADRFGLVAHRETKELPCYELVIGKDGPKLHPTAEPSLPPRSYPTAPGIRAEGISLKRLGELLSSRTDRPVLDRTELSGSFDVTLKWSADPETDPGPSLFTAIDEQLGLKLQATKFPIDALVIDRISPPSEN